MMLEPQPGEQHAATAKGFTLIEVLVALVVVALALTAVVRWVGITATSQAVMEDAVVAQWVADNATAQVLLAEPWPETGNRRGSERMAQRIWTWRMDVSQTEVPGLRRLTVTVTRESEGSSDSSAQGASFDYFAGKS